MRHACTPWLVVCITLRYKKICFLRPCIMQPEGERLAVKAYLQGCSSGHWLAGLPSLLPGEHLRAAVHQQLSGNPAPIDLCRMASILLRAELSWQAPGMLHQILAEPNHCIIWHDTTSLDSWSSLIALLVVLSFTTQPRAALVI